jgi:hypothetical protein
MERNDMKKKADIPSLTILKQKLFEPANEVYGYGKIKRQFA